VSTLLDTARESLPSLVVLAVTDAARARDHATELRSLAAIVPLAVGGWITPADAHLLGARVLEGDPLEAARSVAGRD